MTYAFFLGCVIPNRYPGIERATKEVFNHLGTELKDFTGGSCCPAPGVTRSFDQTTWMTVGARNLAISEQLGTDILTVCNGCHGSLFESAHMLHDENKRAKVNEHLGKIGMEYKGGANVYHFADVLNREITPDKIAEKVKKKLDLNVAPFYGCHFLKPSKDKKIDNPERPRILDDLIEATGANSIDYRDRMTCCGAGGGVRARTPDLALQFTAKHLENMRDAGVDCMVDTCPFCHLQFDRGQIDLKTEEKDVIPVLHLSQFLGLAFDLDKSILGMELNSSPVKIKGII
jgi:heterodisulfide reductase subunit B